MTEINIMSPDCTVMSGQRAASTTKVQEIYLRGWLRFMIRQRQKEEKES